MTEMKEIKAAIVTGSTSGIGLGIARSLAGAGMHVMLNGLGAPDQVRAAQDSVKAHAIDAKQKIAYHEANMLEANEIQDLVRSTRDEFGAVHVLVNNAGVQHTAPIESFPADVWHRIIAINLTAAFHTIQACLPLMKQAGYGRIINIASVHGLVASVEKAGYVAAKHGLIGLTKVVALENATEPVTCNAICPGWVRTPLVEKQIDALAAGEDIDVLAATEKLLAAKQPSKRFTDVSDLGALAVFLCSPAAQNITGAALPVDGGWVAQ